MKCHIQLCTVHADIPAAAQKLHEAAEEGGFARAGSADDEPQSHLIPFFLLVFIYYSIKNEKEE